MKNNLSQLAEIKILYEPKIRASDRVKVKGSKDAAMAFRQAWEYPLELKECFYTLYLNRNNQILGYLLVSVGGIADTVMDVRNILQTALKANACSIIIAHNHPSGNLDPSDTDRRLTKQIMEAGKLLEIPVLDHILLTEEGYMSFADEGLL